MKFVSNNCASWHALNHMIQKLLQKLPHSSFNALIKVSRFIRLIMSRKRDLNKHLKKSLWDLGMCNAKARRNVEYILCHNNSAKQLCPVIALYLPLNRMYQRKYHLNSKINWQLYEQKCINFPPLTIVLHTSNCNKVRNFNIMNNTVIQDP